MKKYVFGLIVILFMSSMAHAQKRGKPQGGDRGEAMMNTMTENLQLDDMQKVMFEDAISKSMQERKALRDQDLSREEMREELKVISENENAAVKKVLDENQYSDFLALKKEMRQKAMEERKTRAK